MEIPNLEKRKGWTRKKKGQIVMNGPFGRSSLPDFQNLGKEKRVTRKKKGQIVMNGPFGRSCPLQRTLCTCTKLYKCTDFQNSFTYVHVKKRRNKTNVS